MILPDVNVLVYAADEWVPEHEVYAEWLNQTMATEGLLLPDTVIAGVLRVATNPQVRQPPVDMAVALEFVDALRGRKTAHRIESSTLVWARFRELCANDPQIRGRLVPDAYLAAVALTHGARLATRDRGFARYRGLRWFDPAQEIAGGGSSSN